MGLARGGRLLMRGGASRHKHLTDKQLTEKQSCDLIGGAHAAIDIGQPFNRFIKLLWERSGVDGRQRITATGHFITLAR